MLVLRWPSWEAVATAIARKNLILSSGFVAVAGLMLSYYYTPLGAFVVFALFEFVAWPFVLFIKDPKRMALFYGYNLGLGLVLVAMILGEMLR